MSSAAKRSDAILRRVQQLLTVAFSVSSAPAERITALQALDPLLVQLGIDSHDLVERMLNGGDTISDADMQRLYDAGYNARAAEEELKRRQAVAVVSTPDVAIDDSGVNGYSWREIAGHCASHVGTIRNSWEAEFIKSVAMNFVANRNFKPTPKQMPILARIFRSWFRGEIL